MENNKYLYLMNIYTNKSSPESFGSVGQIWGRVKSEGNPLGLRKREVFHFVHQFPVHTLHQQPRKVFKRQFVFSRYFKASFEIDLIDFYKLKEYNKGYAYILVCLESVSRQCFLEPLKNKKANTCALAMERIFTRSGIVPLYTFSDSGSEFVGKDFKTMMDKYGVRMYISRNELHSSKVEKLNKTLKTMIYKLFTYYDSLNFVKQLKRVEDNYNHRYHSSVKMAPSQVSSETEFTAFMNASQKFLKSESVKNLEAFRYRKALQYYREKKKLGVEGLKRPWTNSEQKLKVGTKVRLSLLRSKFDKSYWKRFTDEVFVISRVLDTNPITYAVTGQDGEELIGSLYRNEVRVVTGDTPSKIVAVNVSKKPAVIRTVNKVRANVRTGEKEYNVVLRYLDTEKEVVKWISDKELQDY